MPCGGGERIRKILCLDEDEKVNEEMCIPEDRPFSTEPCNTHSCDDGEFNCLFVLLVKKNRGKVSSLTSFDKRKSVLKSQFSLTDFKSRFKDPKLQIILTTSGKSLKLRGLFRE